MTATTPRRPPVRPRPAATGPEPSGGPAHPPRIRRRGDRPDITAGPVTAAPVFVDRSGARHRLAMLTGSGVAGLLVLGLGLMVAGVFGATPLTLPGFPGHRGPGVVTQPSDPSSASATASTTPDTTPTSGGAPTPTPGPSAGTTPTPNPTATPTVGNTHRQSTNSPNPHSSKSR